MASTQRRTRGKAAAPAAGEGSANGVVWDAPPSNRNTLWIERLQPFIDNPGEWGRIPGAEFVTRGQATAAKHRLLKRKVAIAEPDAEWEFEAGEIEGKHYVWAKYLGVAPKPEGGE